jgi:hypothetical protein
MGQQVSRRFSEGAIEIRRPIRSARTRGRHLEFDRLLPQVRLVIGLYQTDIPLDRIAKIVGVERRRFDKIWSALLLDSFTATLIRDGMSGIYSEALPEGVSAIRCPVCKRLLSRVPCVLCWPDDESGDEFEPGEPEDLRAVGIEERSETAPGTAARVVVMADRVSRGYSPFCALDATFSDVMSEPWVLDPEPEIIEEEVLFEEFLKKIARSA